jgi:hypothetical protein
MKTKQLLLLAIILITALQAPCQSKKDRKKSKIKACTESFSETKDGKTSTYKVSYEEFDKSGRSILKIDYLPDGSIEKKESTKYDSYGNKVEEMMQNLAKDKYSRKTSKYNAHNDKTEEVEYDASGNIVKKTSYMYSGGGNKVLETITDGSGKQIEKSIYLYNSRNLKSEKQLYDKSNNLDSSKKWDYLFY